METIKGCIDSIRFQDNDFLIASFKVEGGSNKIVIKGSIPGATVGMVSSTA